MKPKQFKVFLFIVMGIVIGWGLQYLNNKRIVTNITEAMGMPKDNDCFEAMFPLSDKVSNVSIYSLKYYPTGIDAALRYADLFGMTESWEDDKSYYFYNEDEELRIDKYVNSFVYSRDLVSEREQEAWYLESGERGLSFAMEPEEALTYNELIEKALVFMQSRLLYLSFEEVFVDYYELEDEILYVVNFISTLDNIKNYAIMNQVCLNEFGEVMEVKYYFGSFEKLGTFKVKSIKEAFLELEGLKDFGFHNTEKKIILESCTLVYYYESSIIQPAYLFIGTFPDGELFEYYVKACVY